MSENTQVKAEMPALQASSLSLKNSLPPLKSDADLMVDSIIKSTYAEEFKKITVDNLKHYSPVAIIRELVNNHGKAVCIDDLYDNAVSGFIGYMSSSNFVAIERDIVAASNYPNKEVQGKLLKLFQSDIIMSGISSEFIQDAFIDFLINKKEYALNAVAASKPFLEKINASAIKKICLNSQKIDNSYLKPFVSLPAVQSAIKEFVLNNENKSVYATFREANIAILDGVKELSKTNSEVNLKLVSMIEAIEDKKFEDDVYGIRPDFCKFLISFEFVQQKLKTIVSKLSDFSQLENANGEFVPYAQAGLKEVLIFTQSVSGPLFQYIANNFNEPTFLAFYNKLKMALTEEFFNSDAFGNDAKEKFFQNISEEAASELYVLEIFKQNFEKYYSSEGSLEGLVYSYVETNRITLLKALLKDKKVQDSINEPGDLLLRTVSNSNNEVLKDLLSVPYFAGKEFEMETYEQESYATKLESSFNEVVDQRNNNAIGMLGLQLDEKYASKNIAEILSVDYLCAVVNHDLLKSLDSSSTTPATQNSCFTNANFASLAQIDASARYYDFSLKAYCSSTAELRSEYKIAIGSQHKVGNNEAGIAVFSNNQVEAEALKYLQEIKMKADQADILLNAAKVKDEMADKRLKEAENLINKEASSEPAVIVREVSSGKLSDYVFEVGTTLYALYHFFNYFNIDRKSEKDYCTGSGFTLLGRVANSKPIHSLGQLDKHTKLKAMEADISLKKGMLLMAGTALTTAFKIIDEKTELFEDLKSVVNAPLLLATFGQSYVSKYIFGGLPKEVFKDDTSLVIQKYAYDYAGIAISILEAAYNNFPDCKDYSSYQECIAQTYPLTQPIFQEPS